MHYSFKYDLLVEIEMSDDIFSFVDKAIKMNTSINSHTAHGRYWELCLKMRKKSKISVFTLKQLECILLASIEPQKRIHNYTQENRESIIDLYNMLDIILQKGIADQIALNAKSLKYSTPIQFV